MPAKVKYEEKEKVLSLVKSGYSYLKAAKEVGVSISSAHRWCSSVGVKSPFLQGAQRKYDWDEIFEKYKEGKPTTALAKDYGADLKTIQIIVGKMRKKAYVYASSAHWRKLTPVSRTKNGHPSTKVIAIPVSILIQLGFDRDDEIYGRWSIRGNKLVLELKRERPRYGMDRRKELDQDIL